MSRVRNLVDFNHRVMDMDGNTDDNITVDGVNASTITSASVNATTFTGNLDGNVVGSIGAGGASNRSTGEFTTISADTLNTTTNIGTPTLLSSSSINLQAGTGANHRVAVTQSSFQLGSFTTAQIALKTGADGDLVYNRTDHQVQAYQNGAWGSISGGGQGRFPTGDLGDLTLDYVALGPVETGVNAGYDMQAEIEFKTEDLGPGLV
jgi:hypothetical protein